ncbi:MAG: hypothetical protein ABI972_10280 [Acidobacteriota bacterium]
MKSLLIQLDAPTLAALDRIAPPKDRKRSEFIRMAIRRAIREAEFASMREAYLRQPDSAAEADDWSNAEEFKP